MNPHRSSPNVLLHHDGELADVRRILDELGADYVEKLGGSDTAVSGGSWDVVIANPRRALNFRPDAGGSRTTRIAILDGASRTLQTHLRRVHVELIVRRPVHPAALRLLILHALYRGPERRRRRRVSVGAEVRFRRGLFRRPATLTDFSVHGCRLLTRHPVGRGKRIRIALPSQVTGGRSFSVTGSVLRVSPAPAGQAADQVVLAIGFKDASDATTRRLYAILEAHTAGPAVLAGQVASPGDRARPEAIAPRVGAMPSTIPEVSDSASAQLLPVDEDPADRRTTARHPYARRIVALSEQATRVLLGRDISSGGMRVDANADLDVGDKLRIALHSGVRDEPLVVDAMVHRDDGDDGLILRFLENDPAANGALGQLILQLPMLDGRAAADDDDTGAGLVVSEILDREI